MGSGDRNTQNQVLFFLSGLFLCPQKRGIRPYAEDDNVETTCRAASQRPKGAQGSTGEDHKEVLHIEAHSIKVMLPNRRKESIFTFHFTK